jgi:hypothetical protein
MKGTTRRNPSITSTSTKFLPQILIFGTMHQIIMSLTTTFSNPKTFSPSENLLPKKISLKTPPRTAILMFGTLLYRLLSL